MKLTDFVELVHAKVSRTPSILTDPNDESFKVSLKRWSDIDLEVPGAISKPINEADIVLIVCLFPVLYRCSGLQGRSVHLMLFMKDKSRVGTFDPLHSGIWGPQLLVHSR